jgi:hypothetical protein
MCTSIDYEIYAAVYQSDPGIAATTKSRMATPFLKSRRASAKVYLPAGKQHTEAQMNLSIAPSGEREREGSAVERSDAQFQGDAMSLEIIPYKH